MRPGDLFGEEPEDPGRRPELPLARSSDPRSSHMAAAEVVASGTVATHEGRIVGFVRENPGHTGEEIGLAVGLTTVQVLRRTRALEDHGVICRGDQRASRLTGRPGLEWNPVLEVASSLPVNGKKRKG